MGKKNKQEDYNLKDYTWEQENFEFQPKVNRHKKFLHAKKRQLEKEKFVDDKKAKYYNAIMTLDEYPIDEHQRYISKVEQSILQDYYDRDDEEDFVGYRIK